ncbi:MAG: hypothetical protein AAF597_10295 [Bacteroidota bacterium]
MVVGIKKASLSDGEKKLFDLQFTISYAAVSDGQGLRLNIAGAGGIA